MSEKRIEDIERRVKKLENRVYSIFEELSLVKSMVYDLKHDLGLS